MRRADILLIGNELTFNSLFVFYELFICRKEIRFWHNATIRINEVNLRVTKCCQMILVLREVDLSLSPNLSFIFLSLLRDQETHNRHSRSQFSRFKLVRPPQSRKSTTRLAEKFRGIFVAGRKKQRLDLRYACTYKN